MEKLCALLD